MASEVPAHYREIIEKIQPHFAKQGFCGFDIPQGWIFLVSQLHDRLEVRDPEYVLIQAKEKFGALRYYIEYPDSGLYYKEMRDIIGEYEIRSLTTCQGCGDINAHHRDAGWVATLCESCFELIERGYE